MSKRPAPATVKHLFAVSGNRCAFLECSHPLVEVSGKVIGEVCHIRGKRPGSARYDPDQTGIDDFENLLLLCPTHHATIDADPNRYTVTELFQMKSRHESTIKPVQEASDTVAGQLIASIDRASSDSVVISQNQSGGIVNTGTLNINAAPEPKLYPREVFRNKLVGSGYHTRIELTVEAPYPPGNLEIMVRAPSIQRIDLIPQRGGPVMKGHGGVRPGGAFTNLPQPFGKILLEIFTAQPERPDAVTIEWYMQ